MKLSRLALLSSALFALAAAAQTPAPIRVDEAKQVALHGSVSLLAQPQFDRGAVAPSFPVGRALVMLQPSPDREAALQRYLREAHSADSANYHKWLTPEQYGERFGATNEDITAVSHWLESSGFTVARVTKSKAMIEFSGTAAQVRSALHTEIHQYSTGGHTFYANDREITVPAAIASRIRNFAPLSSIAPTSYVNVVGHGTLSPETHRVTGFTRSTQTPPSANPPNGNPATGKPDFTLTSNNAPFYALAPEDFATQYDLGPVYTAGTKGAGQTIGIIGTANLNLALVDAYRTLFSLPADHTSVIVDGADPGTGIAPDIEGFLDVEASGSVAPDASINYYIASGSPLQSSLALAALRAIDDNEASVLSVSYGECEQLLGESGNQLWNGLWQQAAAQGQTVLVASGDSGPNACPAVIIVSSSEVSEPIQLGLSVSGLTSTPWNVSVGGTDFYYSDYATGGASIATFWNQANDSSEGSLKAPLAEQPWNNEFGLNSNPPVSSPGTTIIEPGTTGGGASNCSQSAFGSDTAPPVCIAGYTKPAWQQGTGVPPDGVRDIPDVSLFAANGLNLSAWPICARAGDCTGSSPRVYLVGGTSASTPAMAGIMALVNQKYGRQGQANYTLYALAQQQASVYHDIAIGTNDVVCLSNTPECVAAGIGEGQYNLYAAGTGYDQASGLGTIDASLLLSNWIKAATASTATTLQLSATTITHGSPVNVTAAVTPASGSGTPTGEIVLETTPATSLRGNGNLALTNGTASASVATLPGGTYNVVAQYSGDGVFASSTSSSVPLTVTPEPSATALSLQELYTVLSGTLVVTEARSVANGGQALFGSGFTFIAAPSGQSSGSSGLATGTATFTEGSNSTTVPLGASGTATYKPLTLSLGAHTLTVSYSGDASYAASTSSPFTFTVVKGTPLVTPSIEEEIGVENCSPSTVFCFGYLAGSSPLVHVLLRAPYANVPPTGTVTVTLGSVSQTASLNASAYLNQNLAAVDVTLPDIPAGTYTFTVSYSGDSNWSASTYTDPDMVTFIAGGAATTTTNLTVSPASATSSDRVTFNITVLGSSNQYGIAPTGEIALLANGSQFASGFIGSGVTASPTLTESITIHVPASEIPIGTQQIVANYYGGPGFSPSVSAPVSLTVSASEFTLSSGTTSIAVASGGTISAPLLLGTGYGLTVPVTLTCTPSSSAFACSPNPQSMSVSGSGTAMLTLNAFVPASTIGSAAVPANVTQRNSSMEDAAIAFASLILLGLPLRRRRWPLQCLLALALGTFFIGCGGSSPPSVNPIPPPITSKNTPAGTYSVLVQGVSGGITHNIKVDILVQ